MKKFQNETETIRIHGFTHLLYHPGKFAHDFERFQARGLPLVLILEFYLGCNLLWPPKQNTGSRIKTLQKQNNSPPNQSSGWKAQAKLWVNIGHCFQSRPGVSFQSSIYVTKVFFFHTKMQSSRSVTGYYGSVWCSHVYVHRRVRFRSCHLHPSQPLLESFNSTAEVLLVGMSIILPEK